MSWNRGGGLPVASGTSLFGQVAEVGEWARLFIGVCASAAPPPLYSAGATGAHNPVGLGSPDQRAESRARLDRWPESVEINTNIFHLLLVLHPKFLQVMETPAHASLN